MSDKRKITVDNLTTFADELSTKMAGESIYKAKISDANCGPILYNAYQAFMEDGWATDTVHSLQYKVMPMPIERFKKMINTACNGSSNFVNALATAYASNRRQFNLSFIGYIGSKNYTNDETYGKVYTDKIYPIHIQLYYNTTKSRIETVVLDAEDNEISSGSFITGDLIFTCNIWSGLEYPPEW